MAYDQGDWQDLQPGMPLPQGRELPYREFDTVPIDAHAGKPDDTQLSWEEWNAKVDALLAECQARAEAEALRPKIEALNARVEELLDAWNDEAEAYPALWESPDVSVID